MISPDPVEVPAFTATPAFPWNDGQSGVIKLKRGITVEQLLNGVIQFATDTSYRLSPILEYGIIRLYDHNGVMFFEIQPWEGVTKSITLTAISEESQIDMIFIESPLGFLSESVVFSDRDNLMVPMGSLKHINSDGEATGNILNCVFSMDGVNILAGVQGSGVGYPVFKAASDIPLGFDTMGMSSSPTQIGFENTPLITCEIGRREQDLAWGLVVRYGPTRMNFINFVTPDNDAIFVNNYLGEVQIKLI